MNDITSRCPGSYQGTTPHPQCAQCMRRLSGYPAGYWYIKVPVFESVCPEMLADEKPEISGELM